jgi:hypothetical protein
MWNWPVNAVGELVDNLREEGLRDNEIRRVFEAELRCPPGSDENLPVIETKRLSKSYRRGN